MELGWNWTMVLLFVSSERVVNRREMKFSFPRDYPEGVRALNVESLIGWPSKLND